MRTPREQGRRSAPARSTARTGRESAERKAIEQDRAIDAAYSAALPEYQDLAREAYERGPGWAILVTDDPRYAGPTCLSALGRGPHVALVPVATLIQLVGCLAGRPVGPGRLLVVVAAGEAFGTHVITAPAPPLRLARRGFAGALRALDALLEPTDDPRAAVAALRKAEARIRRTLADLRVEVERRPRPRDADDAMHSDVRRDSFGLQMQRAAAALEAAGARIRGALLDEDGARDDARRELLALAVALDVATKSARKVLDGI